MRRLAQPTNVLSIDADLQLAAVFIFYDGCRASNIQGFGEAVDVEVIKSPILKTGGESGCILDLTSM